MHSIPAHLRLKASPATLAVSLQQNGDMALEQSMQIVQLFSKRADTFEEGLQRYNSQPKLNIPKIYNSLLSSDPGLSMFLHSMHISTSSNLRLTPQQMNVCNHLKYLLAIVLQSQNFSGLKINVSPKELIQFKNDYRRLHDMCQLTSTQANLAAPAKRYCAYGLLKAEYSDCLDQPSLMEWYSIDESSPAGHVRSSHPNVTARALDGSGSDGDISVDDILGKLQALLDGYNTDGDVHYFLQEIERVERELEAEVAGLGNEDFSEWGRIKSQIGDFRKQFMKNLAGFNQGVVDIIVGFGTSIEEMLDRKIQAFCDKRAKEMTDDYLRFKDCFDEMKDEIGQKRYRELKERLPDIKHFCDECIPFLEKQKAEIDAVLTQVALFGGQRCFDDLSRDIQGFGSEIEAFSEGLDLLQQENFEEFVKDEPALFQDTPLYNDCVILAQSRVFGEAVDSLGSKPSAKDLLETWNDIVTSFADLYKGSNDSEYQEFNRAVMELANSRSTGDLKPLVELCVANLRKNFEYGFFDSACLSVQMEFIEELMGNVFKMCQALCFNKTYTRLFSQQKYAAFIFLNLYRKLNDLYSAFQAESVDKADVTKKVEDIVRFCHLDSEGGIPTLNDYWEVFSDEAELFELFDEEGFVLRHDQLEAVKKCYPQPEMCLDFLFKPTGWGKTTILKWALKFWPGMDAFSPLIGGSDCFKSKDELPEAFTKLLTVEDHVVVFDEYDVWTLTPDDKERYIRVVCALMKRLGSEYSEADIRCRIEGVKTYPDLFHELLKYVREKGSDCGEISSTSKVLVMTATKDPVTIAADLCASACKLVVSATDRSFDPLLEGVETLFDVEDTSNFLQRCEVVQEHIKDLMLQRRGGKDDQLRLQLSSFLNDIGVAINMMKHFERYQKLSNCSHCSKPELNFHRDSCPVAFQDFLDGLDDDTYEQGHYLAGVHSEDVDALCAKLKTLNKSCVIVDPEADPEHVYRYVDRNGNDIDGEESEGRSFCTDNDAENRQNFLDFVNQSENEVDFIITVGEKGRVAQDFKKVSEVGQCKGITIFGVKTIQEYIQAVGRLRGLMESDASINFVGNVDPATFLSLPGMNEFSSDPFVLAYHRLAYEAEQKFLEWSRKNQQILAGMSKLPSQQSFNPALDMIEGKEPFNCEDFKEAFQEWEDALYRTGTLAEFQKSSANSADYDCAEGFLQQFGAVLRTGLEYNASKINTMLGHGKTHGAARGMLSIVPDSFERENLMTKGVKEIDYVVGQLQDAGLTDAWEACRNSTKETMRLVMKEIQKIRSQVVTSNKQRGDFRYAKRGEAMCSCLCSYRITRNKDEMHAAFYDEMKGLHDRLVKASEASELYKQICLGCNVQAYAAVYAEDSYPDDVVSEPESRDSEIDSRERYQFDGVLFSEGSSDEEDETQVTLFSEGGRSRQDNEDQRYRSRFLRSTRFGGSFLGEPYSTQESQPGYSTRRADGKTGAVFASTLRNEQRGGWAFESQNDFLARLAQPTKRVSGNYVGPITSEAAVRRGR